MCEESEGSGGDGEKETDMVAVRCVGQEEGQLLFLFNILGEECNFFQHPTGR